MGHVILIGDSIFDNARYVPDRPPVVEQVRRNLPVGWQATLLAVDGNVIKDVPKQLASIPEDATHLFISVGGNDALGETPVLNERSHSVGASLYLLREVQERFREAYRNMLIAVLPLGKPTTVCTIYDAVPGLRPGELAALAIFNEAILREASRAGLPVIDLRLICSHPSDFSPLSPIEPSVTGGAKIARVIAEIAARHDFKQQQSTVYT